MGFLDDWHKCVQLSIKELICIMVTPEKPFYRAFQPVAEICISPSV